MMTNARHLRWAGLALSGLILVGCDSSNAPKDPSTPPGTMEPVPNKDTNQVKPMPVEPGKDAPTEAPKGAANASEKLTDTELAEIKKLPADEQPIALAQMTCPSTGAHLGEMGMPVKQVLEGKTFYLCCESCVKEVKDHPAEILAKLKK